MRKLFYHWKATELNWNLKNFKNFEFVEWGQSKTDFEVMRSLKLKFKKAGLLQYMVIEMKPLRLMKDQKWVKKVSTV